MNYLSIENLSKSYGINELFANLTFGIQKGERVGLIARNGSGKSTLFKILNGQESSDVGNFTFRNGISVGYLGQQIEFEGGLSALDVLFKSENPATNAVKEYEQSLLNPNDVDRMQQAFDNMEKHQAWDYEAQAKKLLTQLGITKLDQNIDEMSGGQLKRLALVKVLLEEPDFLLLDEPTNHLDIEMIEWLEGYIVSKNFTLLLITHDRYFLDAVCNKIIELDRGKWYTYTGDYDYYIEKKASQEEVIASEIDKAQNLMKRELIWIRRQPKARGTKSKARVDAFDDIYDKANSGVKEEKVKLAINMQRMGSKILELHNVTKAYDDKVILDGFKYVFKKGEKIGIIGKNGSGKSTLLELIMGNQQPDSGKVVSGETIVFGYYAQDGMNLKPQQRVIDAVKDIAEVIPLLKGKKITASQLLERFLFSKDMHYNHVSKLSGGEKRRLYLLTILMKNPNFLILDEPTNDFDIPTLTVLEDFLNEFPGCVLVVTHDRYFMDKVVDHLMIFHGDGVIDGYNGTYSNYRISEKNKAITTDRSNKKSKSPAPEKKMKGDKVSYNDQRLFKNLEKEIETLESEKAILIDKLANGVQDHLEIQTISERLNVLEKQLNLKTDDWLVLSEKIG